MDQFATADVASFVKFRIRLPRYRKEMRALSLFSGAGGLDQGFEAAGFEHAGCIERMEVCVKTLRQNRPDWKVVHGDVRQVDLGAFGEVDVVHGGPPCQPFSLGGLSRGAGDERNMWPQFVRAVDELRPRAFCAENVPGLMRKRFADFVRTEIEEPLERLGYTLCWTMLSATDVGVPQTRRRAILVGFRDPDLVAVFRKDLDARRSDTCVGAREALGLPDRGHDGPVPTIMSPFSAPRLSTGVDGGTGQCNKWLGLGLWPRGIQSSREKADAFAVPREGDVRRLCVDEIKVLQGFPEEWKLAGFPSHQLGQLGNSVPPPMATAIASSLAVALQGPG